MAKKGPTLYTPPEYRKRAVREFGYSVRDKVNSHYGYERLILKDYRGLEDGDILIAMIDMNRSGEALFVKWNAETTMLDEVVRSFIQGEVPDITEAYDAIEETIAAEDR